MRQLVYSAIQTPDGTILESLHRHDYKIHIDAITKEEYMIDGGIDYFRTNANIIKAKFIGVYEDEPIEKIREVYARIGYGKPGNIDYGTLRKTLLKDMDDDYLESALTYTKENNQDLSFRILFREKQYRNENPDR